MGFRNSRFFLRNRGVLVLFPIKPLVGIRLVQGNDAVMDGALGCGLDLLHLEDLREFRKSVPKGLSKSVCETSLWLPEALSYAASLRLGDPNST